MNASEPPVDPSDFDPSDSDPAAEAAWNAVYAAREAFYAEHFGRIEGDVYKMMNLMGIWPGGCLVQVAGGPSGIVTSSTFGLTNPDMPATCRVEDYEVELDEEGRPAKYGGRLVRREPRPVPEGTPGYGYELLIFTRAADRWPLAVLDRLVSAEILRDLDLLGRVEKYDGMTIEDLALDADRRSDFFIAPLRTLAPSTISLPNGAAKLLVGTTITREEMNFSFDAGRAALLERLLSSPTGQVSVLDRDSVV